MCCLTPENDFVHVIKLQLLSLGDDTALSSSLSVVAKTQEKDRRARSRKAVVGYSAAVIIYEGGSQDRKPKNVGISRTVVPNLPSAATL